MTATTAPAIVDDGVPSAKGRGSRLLRAPVLIPALVIVAATAYLVIIALGSTTAYYMTVGELRASGATVYGQPVRVAGNVVAGPNQREPTTLEAPIAPH